MKDYSTIGMVILLTFLLYCCAPGELGKQSAKVVNAYKENLK